jgi:phage tail sheath protein FI
MLRFAVERSIMKQLLADLERRILGETQWVVFEPNGEALWERVGETIRRLLRAEWRAGALQGAREDQAFFVRCDRSTMTQDDIDSGRLICEVGIAPVRPAEFVILRIFHHTAVARA